MRRARRIFPSKLLRLALAVSLGFGAGSGSQASSEPLKLRLTFEPATLDWTFGDVPIPIVQNTMRGLFRVDQSGKVVPDLAESSKSQGTQFIVQIRPGVKWSDGVPLRAQDFVDSWQRLKDPKTGSTYSYLLEEIERVSAPSATSIRIELKHPIAYLHAILTHWVTYPVRKDLIEKWSDYGQNPEHMAFLGAFQIRSWQRSVKITLGPNLNSEIHGALSGAEAWIVVDDAAALNLYETNRLDLMTDPGVTAQLKHRSELLSVPSPILYFIGVGHNHPLTQKREGVLALSAALSREEIPLVLSSPHQPTLDLAPSEFSPFRGAPPKGNPLFGLKADRAMAKEWLKKAGFSSGAKVPKIVLHYFETPSVRLLAEWIQNQWKKNLGIAVTLESREPKSYWTELGKNETAVFLNSKGPAFPDWQAYYEIFLSTNPQNLGRWADSDFDRWVEEASHAKPSSRVSLYKKASQRLIWENPGVIPLYFRATEFLIQPRLKGVLVNSLSSVDFSRGAHFE